MRRRGERVGRGGMIRGQKRAARERLRGGERHFRRVGENEFISPAPLTPASDIGTIAFPVGLTRSMATALVRECSK